MDAVSSAEVYYFIMDCVYFAEAFSGYGDGFVSWDVVSGIFQPVCHDRADIFEDFRPFDMDRHFIPTTVCTPFVVPKNTLFYCTFKYILEYTKEMNCPNCTKELRSVSKMLLDKSDGLFCPHCHKIFIIPSSLPRPPRPRGPWKSINSRIRRHYQGIHSRSVKRCFGVMTEEEFQKWWLSTEDRCHYCNHSPEELRQLQNFLRLIHKSDPWKRTINMTVDRKNNALGYLLTNVVKACVVCNNIKGHLLTEEEALLICPKVVSRFFLSLS